MENSKRLNARIAAAIPEFRNCEIDSPAYCGIGVFPGGEIRRLTEWAAEQCPLFPEEYDNEGGEGIAFYVISQAGEAWEVR